LREEYTNVTELISSRSQLAGEDVSELKNRLASLKGIFKAANIFPFTEKELSDTEKRENEAEEKEKKAAENLKNLVAQLELELNKGRIDAMEEGWRKEIEEMDYEHRKRLEQIENIGRNYWICRKNRVEATLTLPLKMLLSSRD
jgi:hypothetical protein